MCMAEVRNIAAQRRKKYPFMKKELAELALSNKTSNHSVSKKFNVAIKRIRVKKIES